MDCYDCTVNQPLYADDAVLIADSEENLKEFDTVCKKRKLKVNAGKSKVMVCAKTERRDRLNLSLNGEMLEEVDSFKYRESSTYDVIDIRLFDLRADTLTTLFRLTTQPPHGDASPHTGYGAMTVHY